jgi:hypothetical protein
MSASDLLKALAECERQMHRLIVAAQQGKPLSPNEYREFQEAQQRAAILINTLPKKPASVRTRLQVRSRA